MNNENLYPPDPEIFIALIEHYGFDYFLDRTLPRINMKNSNYKNAVDTAIDRYNNDYDATKFTVRKAFNILVGDLIEEGFSKEEAIEELAQEGFIIPVTVALYYSADAGDDDIERLSQLIRNRAKRMLEKGVA